MNHYYRLGLKYGYPHCCISEFSLYAMRQTYRDRPPRKLEGTGYIPCIECNAKYTIEELIVNINKYRDSSLVAFNNVID